MMIVPADGGNILKSTTRKVTKLKRIFPRGPTVTQLKAESKRILERNHGRVISFCEAFGVLGPPMFIILLVCLVWTAMLICLALRPNEAANMIMGTSTYDNGEFWMINDVNPRMTMAGAVGLVVVGVFYGVVTLRMLFWRDNLFTSGFLNHANKWLLPGRKSYRWLGSASKNYKRGLEIWSEITSFEGKNRKRWNAFLKLLDLVIETMMFRQQLGSGSPPSLTYGFAGFLAVNSLSCVFNILTDRFSALTEVFIDSIFDFTAAVFFPITTLLYSYYNFNFDRDVYLTYLEVLPPGSFERLARSFASPSEIALFRVNLDSLRISSVTDFMLRISMNLTFCYRFERVLEALIWTRQRDYASGVLKMVIPVNYVPASQNSVPRGVTAVFIAFSIAILLCAHKAISDSEQVCAPHPECVVYAHQWQRSDDFCPCVILIDVDTAPKTYPEWIDPINAYDKVKVLASAGMLRSLQVINRQLLQFPEELRSCNDLKAIQLIYTGTQTLPSWTKELTHLEMIQIEGKYGDQSLINLPDDLFTDMPKLSLIHIGMQGALERIPSLAGVPHLQTLSLGWIMKLKELPAFDHVPKLNQIVLTVLPELGQVPDMSPLHKVSELVVYRPSALCCNGFMGPCDLTHSSCRSHALLQTPAATCLKNDTYPSLAATPFLGSTATQKIFQTFSPFICQESTVDAATFLNFPSKETVEVCEGTPFRQCQAPDNSTGICFSTRFQVLMCLADGNYIALRRLQIEKGIGPKCDPVEEKWLGCGE